MENLKIYLMTVHPTCTCYVERNEIGEIRASDLNQCAFTVKAHQEAIDRVTLRLERITKEGK